MGFLNHQQISTVYILKREEGKILNNAQPTSKAACLAASSNTSPKVMADRPEKTHRFCIQTPDLLKAKHVFFGMQTIETRDEKYKCVFL